MKMMPVQKMLSKVWRNRKYSKYENEKLAVAKDTKQRVKKYKISLEKKKKIVLDC